MDAKTKKNIVKAIGIATGGISAVAIAAHISVYDKVFERYERPDYTLKPGMYCIDRYSNSLQRELVEFYSNDILLQGYYYKANRSKGLVILAHGIHSGADDYLPIVSYLLENRYSVFNFDYKGTYDSKGDSCVGMCESLVDLDNALKFLNEDVRFKKMDKFLIGHSWGGYAVTSVLALHDNIKACASIAGMRDGYTMIIEKGSQYAGKMALISKPVLDVYQRYLFKDYVEYNAIKGINKNNIPILIAHGVEDEVIDFELQSIIAHKEKITNPNVSYYIGKGVLGKHSSIWHSIDAYLYQQEIKSELKYLEINKGSSLNKEEKQEFYNKINHKLYSEVNKELFDKIIDMFNKA